MPRRTKAQWQDLILQQSTSGLSAAEFCRRYELNPKYFSLRKKRLSGEDPVCDSTQFVQVSSSKASDSDIAINTIKLRVTEVELPMNIAAPSATLPLLLDKLLR